MKEKLTSASIFLSGAAPMFMLESWSQVGAWAIVGGSFVLIVRWLMNQFQRALEKNTSHLAVLSLLVVAQQQQHLAHDLTVSGLNPHAGADIDERTNKAFMKYREIQKQFEDVKRLLENELRK